MKSILPAEIRPEHQQLWLFPENSDRHRFTPIPAEQRPPHVEYRDIPGYPGYQAGNDGSVWSCWTIRGLGWGNGAVWFMGSVWHRLRPGRAAGYFRVAIRDKNGRKRTRKVHQLILESFIGLRPKDYETRHLDDNKTNNALKNLCYGTKSENQLDRNGKGWLRGEAVGMAKLTENDVRKIRRLHETGIGSTRLGRQFGVDRGTIKNVLARRTWRHVL
jgi:hypothetical protein